MHDIEVVEAACSIVTPFFHHCSADSFHYTMLASKVTIALL